MHATTSKETCDGLSALLPGQIAYPGTADYKAAEDSYYSAQEEALAPACIAFPTCSEDVALIVRYCAQHNVQFAVRGGGHTSNPGAANIDGGITINLRRMKQVTVNKDRNTVSVGGGARWGEVYPVLDALNLSASGGRVAGVGVGGLTTGGGISFFSGRKGLVCDNVANFEIVTSEGNIINANKHQNPDLFIALRGGSGSNFGIVTRFDLHTFEQGNFLGGVTVTPISTIETQLASYNHLLHNLDPYAAIMMSISWNQVQNGYSIFTNLQYTKPEESPAALQPFLDVKPQMMNTMRISNLSDFAVEIGKFSLHGGRNKFATTTFGGGLDVLKQVYDIWNSSISHVSSIVGTNWAMVIQPLPPAFLASSDHQDGDSLGLSASQGPHTLLLLSCGWSNESDDVAIDEAAQRFIRDVDAATEKAGAYSRYKYLNYAADWQNPLRGYGEKNLANLQAVSKKYDPSQLFQRNCPGGFKVSKA